MNKVELKGNISRDIEVNATGKGKPYCFMSVACTREGAKGTDFISVKVWDKLATDCGQNLVKGDAVEVIGHIYNSSYGEGDAKKYRTDIIADKVTKLAKNTATGFSVADDTDTPIA